MEAFERMKRFQKTISVFLSIVVLLSMLTCFVLPTAAATSGTTGDCTWSLDGTILTISGNGKMANLNWDSELPWGEEITNVCIEEGVTNIGDYAFNGCKHLLSVILPNSINTIGELAFMECIELSFIIIPDNVNLIGRLAFAYTDSLTSLKIPLNMTTIGAGAFEDCTGLVSITIPRNIEIIEEESFSGCDNLEVVIIENGVKNIGVNAFSWCNKLKSITIPKSITRIEDFAFNFCDDLTDVYYEGSKDEWDDIEIGDVNNPLINATIHFDQCILHSYSDVCDTNCDICGAIRSVTHSYDDDCDATCNICKAERTVTHTYENTCDTTCNVCGKVRTITHSFGDYVYNNDATYEVDGTKTRTCSVCGHKETISAEGTKQQKPENPFGDVNETAYYYAPVLWAVEKGVTGGTSATTFSPSNTCSRAQIVTFLWRAAGSPEPTSTSMPFTDVPADAYYSKAVLWAVENDITGGTSSTTFSPANPCTRAQIVTFLWRANGKPAAVSTNSFSDVQSGAYYYDAVLWAVEKGITTGTSSTTFAPANTCNRAQCVTFLYRCYN